jgi:hypothetical protein
LTGFSEGRWHGLINDAGIFLDNWANEGAALGWSAADVFGVDAVAPAARFDCLGLVPLISGGAVVAIDANCASIRTAAGGILRYRRTALGNAVPVWQLEAAHMSDAADRPNIARVLSDKPSAVRMRRKGALSAERKARKQSELPVLGDLADALVDSKLIGEGTRPPWF